jgi:hypothetical protein
MKKLLRIVLVMVVALAAGGSVSASGIGGTFPPSACSGC